MTEEKKETAQEPAAKQPAKTEAKLPTGKPKNCSSCNRALRRKSWYYRDGKYYCKKNCWKENIKKLKKPQS